MSLQISPQFAQKVKAAAQRGCNAAAAVAARAVRAEIAGPGSGELRYGDVQRPSLPGQPPASQSGELEHSIYSQPISARSNVAAAQYGSDSLHSRFLEMGTASIAPRPFIRLPIIERKDELAACFRDQL